MIRVLAQWLFDIVIELEFELEYLVDSSCCMSYLSILLSHIRVQLLKYPMESKFELVDTLTWAFIRILCILFHNYKNRQKKLLLHNNWPYQSQAQTLIQGLLIKGLESVTVKYIDFSIESNLRRKITNGSNSSSNQEFRAPTIRVELKLELGIVTIQIGLITRLNRGMISLSLEQGEMVEFSAHGHWIMYAEWVSLLPPSRRIRPKFLSTSIKKVWKSFSELLKLSYHIFHPPSDLSFFTYQRKLLIPEWVHGR